MQRKAGVLSALLSTAGPEGLAVKLEMADDPLFVHIKDRTIALAQERAAEEADNVALTEAEFAILDKSGESPPTTREAMFSLMRDRLDDIDDLLLQDISPRELPHVHFAPNSGHPLAGWHVRLGPRASSSVRQCKTRPRVGKRWRETLEFNSIQMTGPAMGPANFVKIKSII